MSASSEIRAALAAGLETALGGLTPPAAATPVDPAEHAKVANTGCAWIVKGVRTMEVRALGGSPAHMSQTIAYTIDFQCYKEAPVSSTAALAAQTRVDEMVDAFTDWLAFNVSLGDTCLKALPVGTADGEDAELQPHTSGWTARALLRVEAQFLPAPTP